MSEPTSGQSVSATPDQAAQISEDQTAPPTTEPTAGAAPASAPAANTPDNGNNGLVSISLADLQSLMDNAVNKALQQYAAQNPTSGIQTVQTPAEPPHIVRQQIADDVSGQDYTTPDGSTIAVEDGEDGPVTTLITANGSRRSVAGDVHEIAVKLAHLFGL